MKKGILCISLFFFPSFIFASNELTLSIPSQVALGEEFFVTLSLENIGSLDIKDIKIAGMKDFRTTSQSTQTKFMSVQGVSRSALEYSFGFIGDKEGGYILGPARIATSSGEIWSNTGEIILSGNTLSSQQKESIPSDLPHGLYAEIPVGKYIVWFFVFMFFVFMFYQLLQNYRRKKETKKEIASDPHITQDEIFVSKFQTLGKKGVKLNRFDFYTTLNKLLREYFEYKGIKKSHQMTREELIQDKLFIANLSHLKEVFQKSYYHEFSKEVDDMDSRDYLIKEIISHIKT